MLTIHFKEEKPLTELSYVVVHPYICHLILCTWPLSNSIVFARITPIALPFTHPPTHLTGRIRR